SCCVGYILDYPGDFMAQTFTINNTGILAGAAVQVSLAGYEDYGALTDDLYVSIMRVDSLGRPNKNHVLATRTISRNDVTGDSGIPMSEVDFSSANLHVHAGETLALALSSSHTYYAFDPLENVFQYNWHRSFFGTHPGGEFYVYSPLV